VWPKGILAWLLKVTTKIKYFKGIYNSSIVSIERKDFIKGNWILFMLGLLPLPVTQIGILVVVSTRYYRGFMLVMFGNLIKYIGVALISYYGIPRVSELHLLT